MAKTAAMSRKQQEIREKYGNDKVKMNEEMQKLYEREGASPMNGCLTTMLLPMILLLGVYYSVINPLTNTLHYDTQSVTNCVSYLNTLPGIGNSFNTFYGQIDILKLAQTNEGVTYLDGFSQQTRYRRFSNLVLPVTSLVWICSVVRVRVDLILLQTY